MHRPHRSLRNSLLSTWARCEAFRPSLLRNSNGWPTGPPQGLLMALGWALGPVSSLDKPQPAVNLQERKGVPKLDLNRQQQLFSKPQTTRLPPGLQMSVLIPMLTCDPVTLWFKSMVNVRAKNTEPSSPVISGLWITGWA